MRRLRTRRIAVMALLLVVMPSIWVTAMPQDTNALPRWGPYTKRTADDNADDVDPVNMIFWDGHPTLELAHIHTELSFHLGWIQVYDSQQWFKEDGDWQLDDGQRASAAGGDRRHIRMNQGDNFDPTWQTWTMGTPHTEEEISWPPWCFGDHVTRSFAEARTYIRQNFTDHPSVLIKRVNRKLITQCDGSEVAHDGYYAKLEIYYND